MYLIIIKIYLFQVTEVKLQEDSQAGSVPDNLQISWFIGKIYGT